MKAALNGVLNLSILDGWWVEGYSDDTGFKIGNGEEYENVDLQDHLESDLLYNTLEREVVPLFYDLNEIGLPSGWIEKMKNTINMAGSQFSTQRMIMDYAEKFYVPAYDSFKKLSANNYDVTRKVTEWLDRMAKSWGNIAIKDVEIPEMSGTLYVGQKFPIKIRVQLGEITPNDVLVEIISGKLNSQEQIRNYDPVHADMTERANDGIYSFAGEVTCRETGRFGITARIIPKNPDLPHTIRPKLISWW